MRLSFFLSTLSGLAAVATARIIGADVTVKLYNVSPNSHHSIHLSDGDTCSPQTLECCPLGSEDENECKCVEGRGLTRMRRLRKNAGNEIQGRPFRAGDDWSCQEGEILCCEFGATDPEYQCDCLEPKGSSDGDL